MNEKALYEEDIQFIKYRMECHLILMNGDEK